MSALKQSVLESFFSFYSLFVLFLSCFLGSRGERDLVVVEFRIGERVDLVTYYCQLTG